MIIAALIFLSVIAQTVQTSLYVRALSFLRGSALRYHVNILSKQRMVDKSG